MLSEEAKEGIRKAAESRQISSPDRCMKAKDLSPRVKRLVKAARTVCREAPQDVSELGQVLDLFDEEEV